MNLAAQRAGASHNIGHIGSRQLPEAIHYFFFGQLALCKNTKSNRHFASSFLIIREALNHSASAGGERLFPRRRFRKRWNPVWISRFWNRTDGGKSSVAQPQTNCSEFPQVSGRYFPLTSTGARSASPLRTEQICSMQLRAIVSLMSTVLPPIWGVQIT